jgi:hypothetical protein
MALSLDFPALYVPPGLNTSAELAYLEPWVELKLSSNPMFYFAPIIIGNIVDAMLMGVVFCQAITWATTSWSRDKWSVRIIVVSPSGPP